MDKNEKENNDNIDITYWFELFTHSIDKNCQLKHSKNINISMIDHKMNLPFGDILEINEITNINSINSIKNNLNKNTIPNNYIACLIDNRTELFNLLTYNYISQLSIYFPLSQEKYLLTTSRIIISNNYKEDYNYTKTTDKPNKYFNKEFNTYFNHLNSIYNEDILNTKWKQLTNEDKLKYEVVEPGTIKFDDKKNNDDLSKYEAQEEMLYSKNFSVVYFIPLDIDYVIYPPPQVVANSRKPQFESLYKPAKKVKRFYHHLDLESCKWIVKELNP